MGCLGVDILDGAAIMGTMTNTRRQEAGMTYTVDFTYQDGTEGRDLIEARGNAEAAAKFEELVNTRLAQTDTAILRDADGHWVAAY